MTDEFYRQQAARRGRIYLIITGAVLVIACAVFGVYRAYHDSCTRSFDRSQESVIQSYALAINEKDHSGVANCWQHDPFLETTTGCSEFCISKVYGSQFDIIDIAYGEPYLTSNGRQNLDVELTAGCVDSDQEYSAEITLDTVEQNYPWKHWHIVYSTVGGTVTDPWCK
jgi:hypothetical protein